MKTPRSTKSARTGRHTCGELPRQVPARWKWHDQKLGELRDRLIAERGEHLRTAAEPIERHSRHQADSATDEFDHELALSRLSAEQDALYEVEAAMKRITDGGYGVCEETGKRIPVARLKAVPWTRFREDVAARLERTGDIPPPALGQLRSVRAEPAAALAESEPTVEESEPVEPAAEPPEGATELTWTRGAPPRAPRLRDRKGTRAKPLATGGKRAATGGLKL